MSAANVTVSRDGSVILIRATDEDEGLDVGIPLDATEARSIAAHLNLLAAELEVRIEVTHVRPPTTAGGAT